MISLISENRSSLILKAKDHRRVAKTFIWVGLGLAFGFLVMDISLGVSVMPLFGILSGIFILVGLILAVVGEKTLFDLKTRTIKHSACELCFDEIGAVHMGTHVVEAKTRHGTRKFQHWSLSLLRRSADEEVSRTIEKLNKQLSGVAAGTEEQLNDDKRKKIADQLARMHAVIVSGSLLLVDYEDELLVWQAAEKLAKTLHVPLLDFCGEQLVLRSPAELDLPLVQRLARGLLSFEEPGPLPDGIEEATLDRFHVDPILTGHSRESGNPIPQQLSLTNLDARVPRFRRDGHDEVRGSIQPETRVGDRLTLTWHYSKLGTLISIATVAVLSLAMGVAMSIATYTLMGLIFVVPGIAALFWLRLEGRGHGKNTLQIDGGQVVHRSSFMAHTVSMPLEKLEMLRVNTTLNISLNLMSDEKMHRIPIEKAEQAQWMRCRILSHLAT